MTEANPPTLHPRTPGRGRRRYGWLVIVLLWAAALVLGYTGFALNAASAGQPARFSDLVYRTLQLISIESGDPPDGKVLWPLDVARFLIPFLAAWTALLALLSLFRDRWRQFLVRRWRDHVVICGLSRKGWLLAQGFAGRGDHVAVIEADEAHALIGPCRERGIVVLPGDATDPNLLLRAGVTRAGHLVAVTDDDGINAEIAVRCQDLLRPAVRAGRYGRGRTGSLTCTVHLVDPQLCELARTREMALEEGPVRLALFNVFDLGARVLWSRFGPAPGAGDAVAPAGDGPAGCPFHAVVIGLGRLGESLVVTAARDWHTRLHRPPRAAGRLRITVVDLQAEWKCRALGLRYPQLADVCDLAPLAVDVRWPEFYAGAFLAGPTPDDPPAGAVFVCFEDGSLALRTGLAVHQHLLRAGTCPAPVVVRMAQSGGLARLVDPGGEDGGVRAFAGLHAFGLLDHTCTPQAILGGTHEVLARGLHESYVEHQRALGRTAAGNPSLVGWEALPAALRESNRAQAGGIFRHLAALGYTLAPLVDWDAAFFRFPEPEVVRLAELEHNRFVAERQGQGWRHAGGAKALDARLSPALVPWAELAADERVKTCDTVRELPAALARVGFQVVRKAPAAGAAHARPAGEGEGP